MRIYLVMSTLVCLWSAGAHAQVTLQALSVGTHTQTTLLSDAVHDAAFIVAGDALTTDSGSNDIDCNVYMARYGEQVTYSEGDDNVSNDVEYFDTTFRNNATFVNIVDSINWCGSTGAAGGCGHPINGGTPFIVTRALANAAQAGIVYAHEFGHVLGNEHDNAGLQIMDPDILTVNDVKVRTSTRCGMYREDIGCWNPGGCSLYPLSAAAGAAPQSTERLREAPSTESAKSERSGFANVPIEELGASFIVDRIPVEVDEYYGQKDVEILKQMLADADQIDHHTTILTLIGLISDGNADDVHTIMDYILYTPNSDQKYAAAMALGYIANRAQSAEALEFLIAQRHNADRDVARGSILGLGLSGSLRARGELEADLAIAGVQDKRRNILGHAANDNHLIAALGLKGYYRRND